MEFLLLGPIEVSDDDRPVQVGGHRQHALLAALALRANQVVSTERLIDLMYGDDPPPTARRTLQTYVARLRKALGKSVVEAIPPGYVLHADVDEVDVFRFERLVGTGRQLLSEDPAEAAARLQRGLGLWRGQALGDVATEPGLRPEAVRLEELRLGVLEDRIFADLALGRHQVLIGELDRLVAEFPLRERLWSALLLALYRAGRQAEALRAYQTVRRNFAEELGIEPSPELQRLENRILLHDADLDWEAPPGFEPTRGEVVGNLPAETTSFVGRDREIAQVRRLLDEARLVTLTGTGGCGKTRLALRVSRGLADDFPHGVWFVELSRIRDAELVPAAAAAALGVTVQGGGDPTGHLIEALRSKALLLVLDNYEHLIDAAPLVTKLLESAHRLKVLVTSRERLRISGEHVFDVPPLALPDPQQPMRVASLGLSGATALFIERARAVRPDIELTDETAGDVAAICRDLGGLPLAIELAAARTRFLSPSVLRERLDSGVLSLGDGARDRPARQRTLRNTIDWSYELLREGERRLLGALAVFVGGATLPAIEAVCGPVVADGLEETLESLVDQNLVQLRPGIDPRFEMLEMIHEYAEEKLRSDSEAQAIRRRHCEFFIEVNRRAGAGLRGHESTRWFRVLFAEYPNMRAALEWAFTTGDPVLGCRLIGAYNWFWWLDRYQDLDRWTTEALAYEESLDTTTRAGVGFAAGWLAWTRGEMTEARDRWTATRDRFLEAGDRHNANRALTLLASTYLGSEDDYDQAMSMIKQATAAGEEWDDEDTSIGGFLLMGEIARAVGDDEEAAAAYGESLAAARRLGDARLEASNLFNLGFVAQHRGDYASVERLASEGLRVALANNDLFNAAGFLHLRAGSAMAAGRWASAAQLLGATDRTLVSLGVPRLPTEEYEYQQMLAAIEEQLGCDDLEHHLAEGRAMTFEEAAEM